MNDNDCNAKMQKDQKLFTSPVWHRTTRFGTLMHLGLWRYPGGRLPYPVGFMRHYQRYALSGWSSNSS